MVSDTFEHALYQQSINSIKHINISIKAVRNCGPLSEPHLMYILPKDTYKDLPSTHNIHSCFVVGHLLPLPLPTNSCTSLDIKIPIPLNKNTQFPTLMGSPNKIQGVPCVLPSFFETTSGRHLPQAQPDCTVTSFWDKCFTFSTVRFPKVKASAVADFFRSLNSWYKGLLTIEIP